MTTWSAISAGLRRLGGLLGRAASAHCDTEDGPAVTDGRRALETGNLNHALKWVSAAREDEVRAVFDKAIRVRGLGGEAAELADRLFLETLVRVHRAGEGEGFTGIEPAGTVLPAEVVAADRAIAAGSIEPLRGLISEERWPELQRRFDRALARKAFDVDDLDAARAYVAAYVAFFKYAEGGDHHHHPDHHHGH
jgi:hypothetical protein